MMFNSSALQQSNWTQSEKPQGIDRICTNLSEQLLCVLQLKQLNVTDEEVGQTQKSNIHNSLH